MSAANKRTLFEANNLILHLEKENRKLRKLLDTKYGHVPLLQMEKHEKLKLLAKNIELEEFILKNIK